MMGIGKYMISNQKLTYKETQESLNIKLLLFLIRQEQEDQTLK